MKFATVLLDARHAAGVTQAELSARSGVARPNLVAFEAGRREPRWSTAGRSIEATGATLEITAPIRWSWKTIPSLLWRLPLAEAFRILTPGLHLWWSGPAPRLDLGRRPDRIKAYELVLREGSPEDIHPIVDGALLIDAWDDLVVPAEFRRAWEPVLDPATHRLADV